MNENSIKRIRLIAIPVLVAAFLIIAKLYLVQVVRSDVYAAKADRQYVKPASILFDRGTIFFSTKGSELVAAAGLKSGYTLSVNPTRVRDGENLWEKLEEFVDLDRQAFDEKIYKKNDPYEELARRLSEEDAGEIGNLKIPEIALYKERWRYYPGDKTASQVLGFLSFQGDELGAFYGLEKHYNEILSRTADNTYANFFTEILYGINKNILNRGKFEGDIVLSIEPTVQGHLESVAEKINTDWSSEKTGAIIIDPNTGEIYAMAMSPSFNPNDTKGVENAEVFKNPLVEDVYEMGSIVKPITVASGIDSGAITPDTTYNDKGYAEYNGETIYNFDKKGRGKIDIQTALSNSLNTGMAFVAEKMGREEFAKYFYEFGLGEKTGIDLPYEAKPLADNLKSGRMIEAVTASFGQGIAVSPIGMVKALSALANGGYIVTPHVVKEIDYKIGISKKIELKKERQVLKSETGETITRMLVNLVDKSLLQGQIKNDHYAIAAKTGTAQIADESGGYYSDRYLHSFFGYFPAYNPKFLIFLYTVHPKGVDYASNTLTKPFQDVVNFLISYYNIPPDR